MAWWLTCRTRPWLVPLSHLLLLLPLLQQMILSHGNKSLDFVVADYTIVIEI